MTSWLGTDNHVLTHMGPRGITAKQKNGPDRLTFALTHLKNGIAIPRAKKALIVSTLARMWTSILSVDAEDNQIKIPGYLVIIEFP